MNLITLIGTMAFPVMLIMLFMQLFKKTKRKTASKDKYVIIGWAEENIKKGESITCNPRTRLIQKTRERAESKTPIDN